MRYLLADVADIEFEEVEGKYIYHSTYKCSELAKQHHLGLELDELSLTSNSEQNWENVQGIFRKNAQLIKGLPVTVHAPFSEMYPHAMELRVVKLAYDVLSQSYQLANEVGAEVMVVHLNHVATIYHPEWVIEHEVAFWKEFLQQHEGNTVVALENTIDETPEMMLRIAEETNNPRLGICLDTGHANLSGIPVERWIRHMAPHLKHYHIHNNNGIRKGKLWYESDSHSALGDGSMDMEYLLHMAEELTPNATMTLETSALEKSIQWLKDKHFLPTL